MKRRLDKKRQGFTLVEIIVVITIISILATIVGVSFSGWRQHIAETEMKNDLVLAGTAMEQYVNFNNTYPTTIPSSFVSNSSAVLNMVRGGDGLSYCIAASSPKNPSVIFHIRNGEKEVEAGDCN